ncbi:hypothetical protein JCM3766R1_006502 [Sporobolomyces carnicolor]
MESPHESLAVLLLNLEGDKFSASYVSQGATGGKLAARDVVALAREKARDSKDGRDDAIGSGQTRAFLRGFAATANACFVAEPLPQPDATLSASARILQLLKLYVPLGACSRILLGSLHSSYLYGYLRTLPTQLQSKISLVSTITVAPPYRVLVDAGTFEAWRGIERLFGRGVPIPDVATDIASLRVVAEPQNQELANDQENEAHEEEVEHAEPPRGQPLARIDDEAQEEELKEQDDEEEPRAEPQEGEEERAQAGPPDSPIDLQQFMWDSSPSEAEKSDEWEVAGRKKPPRPTSPYHDLTNGGSERGADSSTQRHERGTKDYRGLSMTSGASRRRKQRERGRRDSAPRIQTRLLEDTRLAKGPGGALVSPLPAWDPPRVILHEPHPCVHHYLKEGGCQVRDCPYSHSYKFDSEWEAKVGYRLFVKSKLCVKFAHGKCDQGEDCLMAHRCHSDLKHCRHGPKCYFLLQGLPHSSPV